MPTWAMRAFLNGLGFSDALAIMAGTVLSIAALATDGGKPPPPPPSVEHDAALPEELAE